MTALWANNKTNTGELVKHRKWVNILRHYLQKVTAKLYIWTQILDPQIGFVAMVGWMDGCWYTKTSWEQFWWEHFGMDLQESRLKTSPTQLIWKVRHAEEAERVGSSWNNAHCARSDQQSDALKIFSWSISQCRRDLISADLSEAVTYH